MWHYWWKARNQSGFILHRWGNWGLCKWSEEYFHYLSHPEHDQKQDRTPIWDRSMHVNLIRICTIQNIFMSVLSIEEKQWNLAPLSLFLSDFLALKGNKRQTQKISSFTYLVTTGNNELRTTWGLMFNFIQLKAFTHRGCFFHIINLSISIFFRQNVHIVQQKKAFYLKQRVNNSNSSLSVLSDERPINLRVVSQNMQEGDLPLGKQLANELKRHHNHNNNNNNNNSNTDETKTPATGQLKRLKD